MRRFTHSIVNALRGIRDLVRTQPNFCIELAIASLVLWAAYAFHLRALERVAVVMIILFVLTAEAANSVLESILDGVSKHYSPRFRMAKDMLAGITLIAAIGSIIIGVIIFYPYIRALF